MASDRNVYVAHFAAVDESSDGPDTASLDAAKSIVGRKASRGLSRPALLMVEVAQRCAAESLSDDELETTPLFVGAPTGAEIALPYIDQYLANESDGGEPHTPANVIRDGRAGNALAFLKFSQGNVCGHVAKATRIRGPNSLFTGAEAGFHALRKACRMIGAGWCERAMVVSGETMLKDAVYRDGEVVARSYRDCAVAIHLAGERSFAGSGPLARLALGAAPDDSSDLAVAADRAPEATFMLMQMVGALGQVSPDRPLNIASTDRWGNRHQLFLQSCEPSR